MAPPNDLRKNEELSLPEHSTQDTEVLNKQLSTNVDQTRNLNECVKLAKAVKDVKTELPSIADRKYQTVHSLLNKDEHLESLSAQSGTTPEDQHQNANSGIIAQENGLFSCEEVIEKTYNTEKKLQRKETNPVKDRIPGQLKKGEHPSCTLKPRVFTKLKKDWKISSLKYPCYIPKSDPQNQVRNTLSYIITKIQDYDSG